MDPERKDGLAFAAPDEKLEEQSSQMEPKEQSRNDGESGDSVEEKAPAQQPDVKNTPGLARLFLVGLGMWFAVFLYSIDQTIVANAIPSITNAFHTTTDVGWYGSAYLMSISAFQLLYGRIYANFSLKYTFLVAIVVFELGSMVCALAPTSIALIVGRAVAGAGGAGILSGAVIIIRYTFPPRFLPMSIASIGIVYGVAAVLGPLLSGVFTSELSWRWCFWINLPFAGVTIPTVFFCIQDPQRPEINTQSVVERLKKIDLIGLLIFIPAVVCLLLALQWGGQMYSWDNGRIIALIILFGVLGIAFLVFEYWKGAEASLPIRIITQRSVAAGVLNGFCNFATLNLLIYYIPFWQQAIRGVTAVEAGVAMLPFIIGLVVTINLAGVLVSKYGYYAPMMILSSIIAPIGVGLLTTWTVDTPSSQWIGYQALAGMGLGLGQQQPVVAVQTVLPKADVPAGTSIMMVVNTLSGAIFVSVGQAVLQNELVKNIQSTIPASVLDPYSLATAGATQVASLVPPEYQHAVLVAYNGALIQVFTIALVMSCITIIGSLTIEWKSVRDIEK